MASIAKGTITLNNLTDSLTVLVSPSSCVISSDYDGSNVDLSSAYADVCVNRGNSLVGFTLSFASSTNQSITYTITDTDSYHKRIAITSLPTGIVSGALTFNLVTSDGYSTQVNFQFAVIREASMFDWVQDWENNKTTIGSTYLITPKIFVGHRTASGTSLGTLSGVYIGPDDPNIGTVGMYGLYEGDEIFRINKDGGVIGGWTLGTDYLFGSHVFIGSTSSYIGVSPSALTENIVTASGFSHRNTVHNDGGVAMFYNSASDYGLEGYLPATTSGGTTTYNKTFSLGHVNLIAGWSFDTDALWIGTKKNTTGSGTANSSSITIGTNGLRGYGWYIDTGGTASFAGGHVLLGHSSSSIAGWAITQGRLSTTHAALVSSADNGALFLSSSNIGNVTNANLVSALQSNGGIYLRSLPNSSELAGYSTSGNLLFYLSTSSSSKIAAWYFDNEALYIGTKSTSGYTSASGYVTLSSSGVRGYKWRLESTGEAAFAGGYVSFAANGSGYLANQNITWDASGNIVFSGSTMELTGAIYVKDTNDVVKAGMLATGTGAAGIRFFAGGSTPSTAPFRVDELGYLYASNVELSGTITATAGAIAGWTIKSNYLLSSHVLLSSSDSYIGMSPLTLTGAVVNVQGFSHRDEVHNNGGVAIFYNSNADFGLEGYLPATTSGGLTTYNKVFSLGSSNKIATWKFDSEAIFSGTKVLTGYTGQSGHITIASGGIRGFKWRLENDGAAAFAGGNVSFAADGSGYVGNGNIVWDTNGVTEIVGAVYITDTNDVIRAGIMSTGTGASGIRFFAGTTDVITSPASAPFRVDEDGKLFASNADVRGVITATSGNIGDWIISNGTIVSDIDAVGANGNTPKVTLDAYHTLIKLYKDVYSSGNNVVPGPWIAERSIVAGAQILLEANNGTISANTVRNINSVLPFIGETLFSPFGIYANNAGVKGSESSDTFTHKAAVVAKGNGELFATEYSLGYNENCIAGVYGKAVNYAEAVDEKVPAPAYGGLFENLKVRGLILNRRIFVEKGAYYLDDKDTLIVCDERTGHGITIFLPTTNMYEGRTIIVYHHGVDNVAVWTDDNSYINSEGNDSISIQPGYSCIFTLVKLQDVSSDTPGGPTYSYYWLTMMIRP